MGLPLQFRRFYCKQADSCRGEPACSPGVGRSITDRIKPISVSHKLPDNLWVVILRQSRRVYDSSLSLRVTYKEVIKIQCSSVSKKPRKSLLIRVIRVYFSLLTQPLCPFGHKAQFFIILELAGISFPIEINSISPAIAFPIMIMQINHYSY